MRHGWLWVLPLLAVGCRADLRPDALQTRDEPAEEQRGRELLNKAAAAQRTEGVPWRELEGVEVVLEDEFFGVTGSFVGPWPEDPQKIVLRFVPAGDRGTVTLETRDGPVTWGIHEWNTWTRKGKGPAVYEQDDDIIFWLPTLEYFLEMAFRLPEAQFVDYAGEAEIGGEKLQRVYLTWGTYGPNDEVDQYLVYIDSNDRLVRADYTVRDFAGFITGTAAYSEFREVDGYMLPHLIQIGSDPPEDLLHEYRIKQWKPGVPLKRSEYAPEDRPPREKP